MDVHVYVHFDSLHLDSGSADRKLDQILAQGAQFMATTSEDLKRIQADLDRLTTAVGSVPALQAEITDLTGQVASLKAGDVVTAQQEADLNAAADKVTASADALADKVAPAPAA